MSERDLRVAEWSLATAAVAFGAFNAFSDNAPTIRQRCREPEARQYLRDLRAGYLSAALVSIGTGAVVSLVLGSPVPVLTAAGGSIAMGMSYESHVPRHLRLLSGGRSVDPAVIDGVFRVIEADR